MGTYTLRQEADWTTWVEHPSGSRHPEIKNFKQAKLDAKFDAENISVAREEAQHRLEVFHASLPKEREGSISGNSEPKLTAIVFAKVLKL